MKLCSISNGPLIFAWCHSAVETLCLFVISSSNVHKITPFFVGWLSVSPNTTDLSLAFCDAPAWFLQRPVWACHGSASVVPEMTCAVGGAQVHEAEKDICEDDMVVPVAPERQVSFFFTTFTHFFSFPCLSHRLQVNRGGTVAHVESSLDKRREKNLIKMSTSGLGNLFLATERIDGLLLKCSLQGRGCRCLKWEQCTGFNYEASVSAATKVSDGQETHHCLSLGGAGWL